MHENEKAIYDVWCGDERQNGFPLTFEQASDLLIDLLAEGTDCHMMITTYKCVNVDSTTV